jgi:histidyl-tRNA synthetase
LQFQAPRGTSDILPQEQEYWRFFRSRAEEVAARFGYERIDTPIFEDARLFVRGVGEVTDIVEKETYTFEDRGGDLLTLRPEGTAPVCRAYLEHGMQNLPQPVRLYYLLPGFRYERPQAGRYRQHHQFGVEILGDADAAADAEVIEVGWRFLESIGLKDLSLEVNSIGDAQCKPRYVEELQAYYRPHNDRLCPDCKRRLEENPLRLLDCKQESCQPIILEAPHSVDYLCDACESHWNTLKSFFDVLGLPYKLNHRLARGFDYYTRTVFEVTPPVEGQQNVLFGGGRYDGLMQELGGRPTPGVGFGMGAERVIASLMRQEIPVAEESGPRVMVAHVGEDARRAALGLASELRKEGVSAVLGPADRALRSQLRYASRIDATHAIILGDDELKKKTVVLRDLGLGEQEEVEHSLDLLVRRINGESER